MPPSGYSQPAVNGLVTFFSQTLGDLRAEVAEGKHASLEAGCGFEVGQIEKVPLLVGREQEQDYVRLVLGITLVFYRRVLIVGASVALDELRDKVSAIHIDEAGNLTAR